MAERAFSDHRDSIVRFVTGIVGDSHLAQDVSQQVFSKLLEHGTDVESGSIRAWLFRVAYNEAIQIKRRESIDRRALTKMAQGLNEVFESTSDRIVDAEEIELIQKCLEQLPDNIRQVFRMRMFDDLKFTEIAEQLEIPLGTALTRMRTALTQIRKLIDEPE